MSATTHVLRALFFAIGLMAIASVRGLLDLTSTECILLMLATLGLLVAIGVRARRH